LAPTKSATDALGEVHRVLEGLGRDRNRVGVGRTPGPHRDEAAGLLDAFKGRAIHHQVPENRKSLGAPRFNRDLIAIVEMAHVELADRAAFLMAVGNPVDHEAARATDALTTVVLEGNRVLALADQILIEDIEHLEKRHMGADVVELIGREATLVIGVLLPPNMQRQLHL
jgi:hypothetical protein